MSLMFSIGIPIGPINQKSAFMVRCGGQLYTLNAVCYSLWLDILAGRTVDESDEVKEAIRLLYANGLICGKQGLSSSVPVRYGVGAGYSEKTNDYVILTGTEETHVEWQEYLLWTLADNRDDLSEIHKKLYSENISTTLDELRNALIRLYAKGAIMLEKNRGDGR